MYNGCPDSKFQKYLDDQRKQETEVRELFEKAFPGFSVTYFPREEGYLAFNNYHRCVSTKFHASRIHAMQELLKDIP